MSANPPLTPTVESNRSAREIRLTPKERGVAGSVGAGLVVAALLIFLFPPERTVALNSCRTADAGCLVDVDSDVTTFGVALATLGVIAALIAVLGVRFNRIGAPGLDLSEDFKEAVEGYNTEPPPQFPVTEEADAARVTPLEEPESPGVQPDAGEPAPPPESHRPLSIETVRVPSVAGATAPIAVTRLTAPIDETDPNVLRAYQLARRTTQRGYFLTHVLGPPTSPGQKYSVAIQLTPHLEATVTVASARFFLGRSWGMRVFPGTPGNDRRFGIVTECYGPFLVLCEVEFEDGERILLDHYCDFEMGRLVQT